MRKIWKDGPWTIILDRPELSSRDKKVLSIMGLDPSDDHVVDRFIFEKNTLEARVRRRERELQATEAATQIAHTTAKKRGRPFGSKNKPKTKRGRK